MYNKQIAQAQIQAKKLSKQIAQLEVLQRSHDSYIASLPVLSVAFVALIGLQNTFARNGLHNLEFLCYFFALLIASQFVGKMSGCLKFFVAPFVGIAWAWFFLSGAFTGIVMLFS